MNGITILDTIEVYQLAWWQFFVGLIPLFVATAIYMFSWIYTYKKSSDQEKTLMLTRCSVKSLILILVGGFLSFISLIFINHKCPAEYVETRYEVKIDENIPFKEVYSNYNIIAEKEDTFIVTKKE